MIPKTNCTFTEVITPDCPKINPHIFAASFATNSPMTAKTITPLSENMMQTMQKIAQSTRFARKNPVVRIGSKSGRRGVRRLLALSGANNINAWQSPMTASQIQ